MAEQTPPSTEGASPPAAPAAPAAPAPKMFKVYGREFDLGTDDGFRQAQTWSEAMSTLVGKQSNEIGNLRQEVEPLRKYNLKNTTPDEVGLRRQVADLRDQGNHLDADNLLFEFARQSSKAADMQLEKERLWNDYRSSRKELFDVLPEDMAKSYVFSNYQGELEKAEDPFSLMDRVLQPKATKLRPRVSAPAPAPAVPAVIGSGPAPSQKPIEQKPEELSPMKQVLKDFGFR